jgi:hypothetical protein
MSGSEAMHIALSNFKITRAALDAVANNRFSALEAGFAAGWEARKKAEYEIVNRVMRPGLDNSKKA